MNRFEPHVVVVCEDQAYKELLSGFVRQMPPDCQKRYKSEVRGGWVKVRDALHDDFGHELSKYPQMRLVALIDFDNKPERRHQLLEGVPPGCRERVLILGSLHEAEHLKPPGGGRLSQVGEDLGRICLNEGTWTHSCLRCNLKALEAVGVTFRQILFVK